MLDPVPTTPPSPADNKSYAEQCICFLPGTNICPGWFLHIFGRHGMNWTEWDRLNGTDGQEGQDGTDGTGGWDGTDGAGRNGMGWNGTERDGSHSSA